VIILADKIIVYLKQVGEPCIPVTVQLEWLPDGKIKPLMYWTPDGSCYVVKKIYESTQLAFLKEQGEGIRIKISADLQGVSKYDDLRYARHEVYLYLADNRFCEKGFIDDRYTHDKKRYIPVVLDIFPDGDYELVYFKVSDNRYKVERTNDKEVRGSFSTGGIGIRHDVDVRLVNPDNDDDPNPHKCVKRSAAIYYEVYRWWIAVKAA